MASGTFGFRAKAGDAVKIEGLSKLQKDLRKLSTDALDLNKQEFLSTNKKVAEIIIDESKKYIPVRSGALAQSVRNASTKKSAKIRAGSVAVPYAGPIHFGWPSRGIRPNPFLYDAIDRRRDEVRERYVDLIDALTMKYDLR
jgi:hypothetical protein